MTVIDIHTHMLGADYLRLLTERSGKYSIRSVGGGAQAIHNGDAPMLTLDDAMLDYAMRISAMDDAGVDVSVVSLTAPNVYFADEDTSRSAARLMNDEMAEAARSYPDRIRFLASLPWQYPAAAAAELERALSLGAVGVMVLANIDEVSLADPRFAPVWEAIDRHALPVLVHPGTPPGVDRMDINRYHLVWSNGFTFDTTLALSHMILDGFFERYQNLHIIGAHAGGYLPFLLARLDHGFRSFPPVRETISRPPSEYANRICVDSIVYSPEALRFTLDTFGTSNVLFGTDYPHKCGDMSYMRGLLEPLPATQREAIASGNAQRLFTL